MHIFLNFAEPLKGFEVYVWIVGVFVVLLGGVALGAYIFLRVFANIYTSRQSNWDSAGVSLGLDVDESKRAQFKPLTGEKEGFATVVNRYTVVKSKNSADNHAEVKVTFRNRLPFSFEVAKPEDFERVVDFFNDRAETGIDFFDEAFSISSSNIPALVDLLTAEIPDEESTNLLNDLMKANKSHYRVKFTNEAIVLGSRADIGDAAAIEQIIARAVRLARRVELLKDKI